ncbi:MAG TPA: metallophosphoesterase [Candidatus Nanoarchaeia archaeon]|nr:metallophosphoesterase [Candidatus Nanoarchaeia archaeon]
MKILAFVDLHENQTAWKKVKEKAKDVDVVVCAGDISIFEHRLSHFLKELNNLKKPVMMIHGNHESDSSMRKMCRNLDNIFLIHKNRKVLENCLFLGYGGGGFRYIDKEFDRVAKSFKLAMKEHPDKVVFLVTHAPPYNTRIDQIMRKPCGNKNIKKFVIDSKPDYTIAGHIHECAGKKQKIGKCLVINPGPKGKILTA